MVTAARQWFVDNLLDVDGIDNVLQAARIPQDEYAAKQIWGNRDNDNINCAFVFPKEIKPINTVAGGNTFYWIDFEVQFFMSFKDSSDVAGSTQERFDLTVDNILTALGAGQLLSADKVHMLYPIEQDGLMLLGDEGLINFLDKPVHAVKWTQKVKTRLT